MVKINMIPLFYESIRNRYNMLTVLRKDDCFYDKNENVAWQLVEDANSYGIAKCVCISNPNKKIRIGQFKLKSFYDETGKISPKYIRKSS